MLGRRFVPLVVLLLCSCASRPPANTRPSDSADLPKLLLPEAFPDIQLGTCVALGIAAQAEMDLNQATRAQFGSASAAMSANWQEQEAWAAHAAAAGTPKRASRLPDWRSSTTRAMSADHAAAGLSSSYFTALRFAAIASHHATLFEIEARLADGQSTESRRDRHPTALHELPDRIARHPDLEFLYVDRFIRAYDAPPEDCRPR